MKLIKFSVEAFTHPFIRTIVFGLHLTRDYNISHLESTKRSALILATYSLGPITDTYNLIYLGYFRRQLSFLINFELERWRVILLVSHIQ